VAGRRRAGCAAAAGAPAFTLFLPSAAAVAEGRAAWPGADAPAPARGARLETPPTCTGVTAPSAEANALFLYNLLLGGGALSADGRLAARELQTALGAARGGGYHLSFEEEAVPPLELDEVSPPERVCASAAGGPPGAPRACIVATPAGCDGVVHVVDRLLVPPPPPPGSAVPPASDAAPLSAALAAPPPPPPPPRPPCNQTLLEALRLDPGIAAWSTALLTEGDPAMRALLDSTDAAVTYFALSRSAMAAYFRENAPPELRVLDAAGELNATAALLFLHAKSSWAQVAAPLANLALPRASCLRNLRVEGSAETAWGALSGSGARLGFWRWGAREVLVSGPGGGVGALVARGAVVCRSVVYVLDSFPTPVDTEGGEAPAREIARAAAALLNATSAAQPAGPLPVCADTDYVRYAPLEPDGAAAAAGGGDGGSDGGGGGLSAGAIAGIAVGAAALAAAAAAARAPSRAPSTETPGELSSLLATASAKAVSARRAPPLRADWELDPAELAVDLDAAGREVFLGRGSFAVVYQVALRGVQPVAIKVLPGAADGWAAFVREAAILARVSRDRNIVQLYGTVVLPPPAGAPADAVGTCMIVSSAASLVGQSKQKTSWRPTTHYLPTTAQNKTPGDRADGGRRPARGARRALGVRRAPVARARQGGRARRRARADLAPRRARRPPRPQVEERAPDSGRGRRQGRGRRRRVHARRRLLVRRRHGRHAGVRGARAADGRALHRRGGRLLARRAAVGDCDGRGADARVRGRRAAAALARVPARARGADRGVHRGQAARAAERQGRPRRAARDPAGAALSSRRAARAQLCEIDRPGHKCSVAVASPSLTSPQVFFFHFLPFLRFPPPPFFLSTHSRATPRRPYVLRGAPSGLRPPSQPQV
jgi:hypothetical protein